MNLIEFIIYYFVSIYLVYILFKGYSYVSKKEYILNVKNIIILLITAMFFVINNLYNLTEYKIMGAFLIQFISYFLVFKDKISKRGLRKIWEFDNWQYIHPEYHTEENKYWHAH